MFCHIKKNRVLDRTRLNYINAKETVNKETYPLHRSQAVNGSSVETFGPYPQDYTMNICIMNFSIIIGPL